MSWHVTHIDSPFYRYQLGDEIAYIIISTTHTHTHTTSSLGEVGRWLNGEKTRLAPESRSREESRRSTQ